VPNEKAIEIRDDVGFFQAVRAVWQRATAKRGKLPTILTTPSGKLFRAPWRRMKSWIFPARV